MARRKTKKQINRNALDYIALPKIDLDPDVKKGVFIILILLLGIVSLLGLFDMAGNAGVYLTKGLTLLLGWGKWIFPIILLGLGYFMYNEDKYYVKGANYLGLFLFIVSWQSFLHFFIDKEEWQETISTGAGGGYLGLYLAKAFDNVLGFWGGLVVIIGLLIISLMLMFNKPLAKLIGAESLLAKIFSPISYLWNKIFNKEEYEEEYVEEGEVEQTPEETGQVEKVAVQEAVATTGQPEFMKTKKIGKKINKKEKEEDISWKPSNVKIDLPLDLLSNKAGKPTSGDIKTNALIIQKTFENFGISIEMNEVSVGPTVTQYTFKPAEGVKLSRITTLSNDLALALAAHPIRIEAPIPGKSLVGIEVPNKTKAIVSLREVLNSAEFKGRKNNLMMALGRDVAGKSWLYDIAKMPHLLVAGATNSGKSVCLNALIVSLLYQNDPDDLRFIMVDPKRVELPVYNGIPHLLTPVITDVNKTINALKWCLNEMDRRFEILAKHKKRNIQTYNASVKPDDEDGKMPYLVFIIDELADLMVVAARDIEASIIRIAQMARAVGIHLVLATQRPSVDVITGLIKANTPARIAFSVASGIDSKTILDSLGAEKLLGQGDMLLATAEISKPKRIQGAYVGDNEIKRVVDYIKEKGGEAEYVEGITDKQKVKGMAGHGMDSDAGDGDQDDLFEEAKEIVINMGKASASLLQRRLSVGYARAARILDELEEAGIVGEANGSKPREIMISKEQYESMINQGPSGVSLHDREETEAPDSYLPGDSTSADSASVATSAKGAATVDKEVVADIANEDEETMADEEIEEDENEDVDESSDDVPEEDDDSSVDEATEDEEDDGMYFAK